MFLNEKELRYSVERRKQFEREAQRQRLAREALQDQRRERKISPIWARVWILFF